MSLNLALAHIIAGDDGTSTGVWGPYTLKSAFQPIFTFQRGKLSVCAFEGLIRPFRDDRPVPPMNFFNAISAIDRLSVETLTRTLHLLNAGACLPGDAAIFVNFDPSVFIDRSIADTALRDMRLVLAQAGIDPRRVVCEVTEQRSASQEALHVFVGALKANGFKIAVDDYGSQDSDIDRIRALQPDIVKFDAQWITRLMESGPGFALLSAMVDIFAKQRIQTVFEGLEENWQLELAEKSGASMVQGYVIARPQIVPGDFSMFAQPAPKGQSAAPDAKDGVSVAAANVAEPSARSLKSFGRRAAR